jgi:hypothetical protein
VICVTIWLFRVAYIGKPGSFVDDVIYHSVKPDGFVRDVIYCDLHDPLLIEETNSKRLQAKCCYVCGVYDEK